MRLFLKYVLLLLVAFQFTGKVNAQEFDYLDKLPFEESKTYLKKAAFLEDESYSSYDLYFQRMEWEVDPSVRYISGAVTSYFKPLEVGFSSIVFDLEDNMLVDSIIYHDSQLTYVHELNKITVTFPSNIPINQNDSLTVYYQGEPTSTGFGSFETTTTTAGDPVMWTLSEPYGAKEWWPCKQSLSDKIDSIEVRVICPAGNKVASNGVLLSETTVDDETTVIWKHHYPITTYLVAIAVTNYAENSYSLDLGDGRQLELLDYVYPSYLESAESTTENTKNIMALYNELVGEYPFADEKYGHAQFGWGGGMEHQTMSFMYNLSFGLVAHEMAHQWFGDCITLNSWHDIWLNEGFATYLTGLSYENLLDGQYWEPWKEQQLYKITASTGGSVYVEDTTSVSRIFSSQLSYAKGAYLLHMLRWELGDENFFTALSNYFEDPDVKYVFASQEDWVGHLESAGDTTLTEFFNDWYYGEGYPVYQVDCIKSGETSSITITQTTSDESVDFFEMHVPVRIWKDGDSTDVRLHQLENPQTFEFDMAPDSIEFDPDLWIISKGSVATCSFITEVEEIDKTEFKIYPNPVSDYLNIELPSREEMSSVRILDVSGRERIYSESASKSIDVSTLPGGIYFISVRTQTAGFTSRFVKQGN